jgi:hypothetical protein
MSNGIPINVTLYDIAGRLLGTASIPAGTDYPGVIQWGSRYFLRGIIESNYHETTGLVIQSLNTERKAP